MRVLITGNYRLMEENKKKEFISLQDADLYYCYSLNEAYSLWLALNPKIIVIYLDDTYEEHLRFIERIRSHTRSPYTFMITISLKPDIQAKLDSMLAGADYHLILPILKEEVSAYLHVAKRLIPFTQLNSLVWVIAKLIEIKDPDAGSQLHNIATYSLAIAQELQKNESYRFHITPRFLEDLQLYSIIHDVGKIGIPDAILQKTGALTTDERKIMQQHAMIGSHFIEQVALQYPTIAPLYQAKEIIEWHHERFDGTGYPKGAKANEIPLSARIVALADVYDALVSQRAYKRAYTHQEALANILQDKGHFDPDVLQAFIQIESTVEKIALSIQQTAINKAEKTNPNLTKKE